MVSKTILIFLFLMIPFLGMAQISVKQFGAVGNGKDLETKAIQNAIDKAGEEGGGTVVIPPGKYKIGTLILRNNIELHLQPGAVLIGSADYKDYQQVNQITESRTKDLYAKYFMIFAEGVSNISITGRGEIYGNGLNHYEEVRPQNLRPFLIRLVNCSDVLIRDVKLLESANWTLHLLNCSNVNIDGISIETRGEGNRDGLDIDGCNGVRVLNSRFLTTDDAIVLKATNDKICENVLISNCEVLGSGGSGIKTGTESNGGFRNITVTNCIINNIPVHAGLELMQVDGGVMENITISNIVMNNVATPFFIRLGSRLRPYKIGQYVDSIGKVKDIRFSNIIAGNAIYPSSIIGLHSKRIENISLTDITVRYKSKQVPVKVNNVPLLEFDYPAAIMFENLPAFGLYCRSANNVTVERVSFYSSEGDTRPAILFDRVNGLSLNKVTNHTEKGSSLAYFRNTANVVGDYNQSLSGDAPMFIAERPANKLAIGRNGLSNGQKLILDINEIKDISDFDDFDTKMKYMVSQGDVIDGHKAVKLSKPFKFRMNILEKDPLQLCLLIKNTSGRPQKINVTYNGVVQEFNVDWKEWGWAPISLMQKVPGKNFVEFEISASGDLYFSKAYLVHRDIGFTD